MSWSVFEVSLQLGSEIHAGRELVGNLLRTRPYITGKTVWGGATARLTRALKATPGAEDYALTGKLIQEKVIFGCFFPAAGGITMQPAFSEKGVRYGDLSAEVFEYQMLTSRSSTALEMERGSATEGSLHEVETLRAYCEFAEGSGVSGPVSLEGHVFADIDGDAVSVRDGKLFIEGVSLESLFGWMQLGGERAYGCGRIAAAKTRPAGLSLGGHGLEDGEGLRATLSAAPFPALVEYDSSIQCIWGEVSPLVGREWRGGLGSGEYIGECALCWEPGSCFAAGTALQLGAFGIWRAT